MNDLYSRLATPGKYLVPSCRFLNLQQERVGEKKLNVLYPSASGCGKE